MALEGRGPAHKPESPPSLYQRNAPYLGQQAHKGAYFKCDHVARMPHTFWLADQTTKIHARYP